MSSISITSLYAVHVVAILCLCSIAQCGNGYMLVERSNSVNDVEVDIPPPPPVDNAALYARYIVHNADWCTVSFLSRLTPEVNGFPMARVFSFADGTIDNSSGIPYIYTTLLDSGSRDLKSDSRSSFTISLAQGTFCDIRNLDPEDPRCPQVILTGNFLYLKNTTDEWRWAKKALFQKHPAMKTWPKNHEWQVGKLDVTFITLVDNIGGSKYPSVKDYFNAKPEMFLTERALKERVN